MDEAYQVDLLGGPDEKVGPRIKPLRRKRRRKERKGYVIHAPETAHVETEYRGFRTITFRDAKGEKLGTGSATTFDAAMLVAARVACGVRWLELL